MRVYEDSFPWFAKDQERRLWQSSRFHHLCRFILGSEKLDEPPSRALFDGWAEIAWFSLARRYHEGSPKTVPLVTSEFELVPLKQLQQLRKCECATPVEVAAAPNGTLRLSENVT